MMRLLLSAIFLLASVSCAVAQEAGQSAADGRGDGAADLSAAPTSASTLIQPRAVAALSWAPTAASGTPFAPPFTSAAAEASPAPAPSPKMIFGGRDDFRWQLAIGPDWYRFRSNIFNASAVGIKTSVTYFTNEWFAFEGNVTAAFAPQILAGEHVKLLVYGAGPKIAWHQRRWEPYLHAIIGGSHEIPQTADNSKNSFAVEVGGGADYRQNPRLSYRLEGDWVHTSFFNSSQNNFELMGGVVFHF